MLTADDIRHGLNAYQLVCRENKRDELDMNYDKVQRALRVSLIVLIFSLLSS